MGSKGQQPQQGNGRRLTGVGPAVVAAPSLFIAACVAGATCNRFGALAAAAFVRQLQTHNIPQQDRTSCGKKRWLRGSAKVDAAEAMEAPVVQPGEASATCAGQDGSKFCMCLSLTATVAAAVARHTSRRTKNTYPQAVQATINNSVRSGATVGTRVSSVFAAGAATMAMPILARRGFTITKNCRATLRRAMMFERFTEKTLKAVMMAQAESRRLGKDHVGTRMLIVGIVAEGTDVGCRALAQLGVLLPEARTALEEAVGRGQGGKAMEIPFTASAKKVLEDAIECARVKDNPCVCTSHLLRAIIQQENGTGEELLRKLLGSDSADTVRERVVRAIEKEEGTERLASGTPADVGSQERKQADGLHQAASLPEVKLTETLKYGEDLTLLAMDGKLEPMVGRKAELARSVRILGRRSKNNPVLVGEAGVGKTSIAHGLAQLISEGKVPSTLRNKRVIQLDLALLLAGTRYRGDFEERLRAVVKEVTDSDRQVILVIDEVHTLVGAGAGGDGSGLDAANLMKPALARGDLQCIGATTLDEYRQYIEKDPALERRFQPVRVPEPSKEEAVEILQGLAPRYEKHHQLRFTKEALVAAVKLSSQYIADRFLPDKAIDVMDEAGSKVRQELFQEMEDGNMEAERWAVSNDLEAMREKKKSAVQRESYEEAQRLKVQEIELLERLEALRQGASENNVAGATTAQLMEELQALKAQINDAVSAEHFGEAHELKVREHEILDQLSKMGGNQSDEVAVWADRQVTEEDVAQVVAGWTGIAVEQVGAAESTRLLRLEAELHRSIVGQDEAVRSVARALRRARAGLRDPERPMAGFMFCGPTGVGKTALCKTLAKTFFGTDSALVRLDMSEYMEKHTVSKLIGSPPGYVGYNDGGTLTEAIRRRPYSLVLFDEVEKAHPDVFNMLLQLLDDGRLTDSKGRTVSFTNCLVVMTSNLGSRSVQKSSAGGLGLGFGTELDEGEQSYGKMKELVHEEMKGFFRPEFLNRLDELIVFRPLSKEDVRNIAEVEFKKIMKRLSQNNLEVVLSAAFKCKVLDEGYDPTYGARPLRRAVTRLLEDSLTEAILADMEQEAAQKAKKGSGSTTSAASAEETDEDPSTSGSGLCRHFFVDVDEHGSVRVTEEASALVGDNK